MNATQVTEIEVRVAEQDWECGVDSSIVGEERDNLRQMWEAAYTHIIRHRYPLAVVRLGVWDTMSEGVEVTVNGEKHRWGVTRYGDALDAQYRDVAEDIARIPETNEFDTIWSSLVR